MKQFTMFLHLPLFSLLHFCRFVLQRNSIPLYVCLFFINSLFAQEKTPVPIAMSRDTALARQFLERTATQKMSSDSVVLLMDQAAQIYINVLGKNSLEYTNCLWAKAVFYNANGKLEEAVVLQEEIIDLRVKLFGENHEQVAKAYARLGGFYRRQGAYDLALTHLKKSIAIFSKLYGDTNVNLAAPQADIAIVLAQKGDYDQSISWHLKTLAIALNNKDNPLGKQTIQLCYNGLGVCYKNKEEYEKAVEYYHKGLDFIDANYDANHYYHAVYYMNLSIVYKRLKQFDKSLAYGHKNANWYLQWNDPKIYGLINAFDNLAEVYGTQGDFGNALKYAQKALDIALAIRGEKSEDAAYAFHTLGEVLKDKRNFDSALVYYNRGLAALGYANEKDLPKIQNLKLLQEFLVGKNHCYFALYRQTQTAESLEVTAQFAKESLTFVDYYRNQLRYDNVSNLVASATYPVYETAIATTLYQSAYDKNPSLYRENALQYAEQSKSFALYQSMRRTGALAYAGIPTDLEEKERQLNKDIALFEKKRQDQRIKGLPETDTNVLRISAQVFNAQQNHDTLLRQLEHDYPAYFHLKYDNTTLSVRQIQEKLLKPNQCLLEYFIGDSSIFIFAIQQNKFAVFDIKKDFPLENWVRLLRGSMTDNRLRGADEYSDLAYQLYQKLVLPAKDLLTENLIIIPDGVLGYLPFEALLTAKPDKPIRFKDHAYLLRQHQIQYCYSATLLKEMQDKKHLRAPSQPFAAFAPYFTGDTTSFATVFANDETLRKGFQPLKSSGEEAAAAAKLMRGKVFFGKDATEEHFTQSAGDYRILHLATHAKANDKAGDYSFLAFSEIDDGEENELLFVRELYNLQLNADLVVLSACETGIGKWQRGEGIMSLARAFTYSGAKGIVTSLWAVNDVKTKDLMVFFYKNLKRGMGKAEALRQAKLSFLDKNSSENALPYFWAGFVGIGDL